MRLNFDEDFDLAGKYAAGLAIVEMAIGALLWATAKTLSLTLSFLALSVVLGSILALCTVTVPRAVRVPLIAGLTILFVITGATVDLLGIGAVRSDVTALRAADDHARPDATQGQAPHGTAPMPGGSTAAPVPIALAPADAAGAEWAGAIGTAVAHAMADAGSGRRTAITGKVVVDRRAEPDRVGIDWAIAMDGTAKSCGTITMSVTDKAVTLDQIAAIFRTALKRSAASDAPRCF